MTTDTATALAQERIRESAATIEGLLEPACLATVAAAAELLSRTVQGGGKVLLFGNGGSAADATHIAAEFVGRFLTDRRALPALSLSDNASAVTAIGNDYGYERVFARQVEAHGAEGDVAFGISTSGTSANVLAGPTRAHADVCIEVPSAATPRIQEAHTLVAHILCELVERDLG